MTNSIALAGKGGTGKTTLAALLIRSLLSSHPGPLLAIDADPAANLHLALGLQMPPTVGEIREEMARIAGQRQLGMAISRQDYLTREVRMSLEEGEQIDLLAMGRPEGPGCYCAFNSMLRQIIDQLSQAYSLVVIDNEAGMEHISRRTTRDVELLLLVTDPTVRGVRAAAAMSRLAGELEVKVRRMMLIVNRVEGPLPATLQEAIEELGLGTTALIPADENLSQLDALGQPLVKLGRSSPAYRAVEALTERILASLRESESLAG